MNYGILPKLTKDYIFTYLTQESIMEKYLNLNVNTNTFYNIPSFIRNNDENPSGRYYYNENGKLRFKDFGGTFNGDCFDVVGKAIGVNCNSKKEFIFILHTIAKDFRIHKYVNSEEVNNYTINVNSFFEKRKKKRKTKAIFKIIPRTFNYHDFDYWKKFNINEKLLHLGKVYPAEHIYIFKNNEWNIIYRYSRQDPAYCYYGGKDDNKIDNWKIYYPYRKKGEIRFHSNSSFLQGKHLITCDRVGIITKAYKDVLSFKSFGLQAVAPSAESVLLTKEDYWFMKTKFDYLISCMDYDAQGIRMMKKLWKHYRITPFMFTDGRNNTYDYKAKDFAEYVNNFGNTNTIDLLTTIFNKHKYEMYHNDTKLFNKLKHTHDYIKI